MSRPPHLETLRIGNACGFWGDSIDAPRRLVEQGNLHYLTLEYLAELTMSILTLLRQRDPKAGYATDFIDVLEQLAPFLKSQPTLKIVTNAGGVNPQSCALAARAVLEKHGVPCPIAVVSGDDLLPRLPALILQGQTFAHLDTGELLEKVLPRVVSANAYLGAGPIMQGLDLGARIVITGRVADAALTLGPAAHEFNWSLGNSIDRIAAGLVAGHLIECGAQVTGGLWCSADAGTHLETVGYPIAEMHADGTFVITKPAGTGGAVNRETVVEQLLYEVADPARYYTPDGVADFTSVKVEEVGADRVRVTGARGLPATDTYKVSIAYRDGYTAAGTLVLVGPNAVRNARNSGKILLDRLRQAGFIYEASNIEVLGAGDTVPGVLPACEARDVVLRVSVRDPRKSAVERFTKEFAPLVTSGFPATTGYTSGRPTVRETFAYWPALVDKSVITPQVELLPPTHT